MTYASRTGTFTTVNGTIGGGLAFNPTYNATNLTLTVGPSPAPGLEAPPLTASLGGEIYHEAHEVHEVGPKTEKIFHHGSTPLTTGSAHSSTLLTAGEGHEGKKREEVFGDLKLDVAQSAALTRAMGKDWLFYTME